MWKENFFDLIFSKDYPSDKFSDALNLKNDNIPKSLYKYKELSQYTLDLLSTDLIYLASVNEFNDPYEGEIFYNIDEVFNNFLENIVVKVLNQSNFEISNEEKDRILNSKQPTIELWSFIYNNDPIVNKEIPLDEFIRLNYNMLKNFYKTPFEDFNSNLKNSSLIVCFSESNSITPMWAHALNHTGICIEYDLRNFNKIFLKNSCVPVNYIESINQSEDLKNMGDERFNKLRLLRMPFLNKSSDWSYEKEWRLLLTNDPYLRGAIKKIKGNYFVRLPKPTAVYLGLNIGENKEKVLEICKYREIPVFQMEKDTSNYNSHTKKILDFPKGNITQVDYIKECIISKNYKTLLRKYFFKNDTVGNIKNSFDLIISSFNDIPKENIF